MFTSLYKTTKLCGRMAVQRDRNRKYMMSLTDDNLLLPYYLEAGLRSITYLPDDLHDGWDSPLSQIRGNVLSHWLSAAAMIAAETGDTVLKARADYLVGEIAKCQEENGGEWCFSIPEKYLCNIKRGKRVWAPHYVCHKTMMGLLDMYKFLGNTQALDIVIKAANWFLRYTDDITPEHMVEIMWNETGAVMELFADLYAITGDKKHLTLMRRYERKELFDLLETGDDPLSNMHANHSIPEIHGAARAYEVTGEERYRKLTERYWDLAVEKRGTFVTGSQTSGEVWTPAGRESSRLAGTNQEHCVVYNMMRLADYLFRWTGDKKYADYWEKNYYNGILAQGYWVEQGHEQFGVDSMHPQQGLIAYHLPLQAGAHKVWGSATKDFWCCHGTLLQANAFFPQFIYYRDQNDIYITQYQESTVEFDIHGTPVKLVQSHDSETGDIIRIDPCCYRVQSRPDYLRMRISVECENPVIFTLALRNPDWLASSAQIRINGESKNFEIAGNGFLRIDNKWNNDIVDIILEKKITAWPLADRRDTVAFLDGPVALAGLADNEMTLYYCDKPEEILIPHNERIWAQWLPGWQTTGQERNIVFKPLFEIGYETFTTYFPTKKVPK